MPSRTLVLLLTSALVAQISAKCSVSINSGLGDPQTLVLKKGLSTVDANEAFWYPTNGDLIEFNDGDVAVMDCPGSTLYVSGSSTGKQASEATCSSGSFSIEGKTVQFNAITCQKLPTHIAQYTGRSCLGSNKEIEVGYKLADGRFVQSEIICFDPVGQNNLYTKSIVNQGVVGYQSGFPRPDFVEDDFYNVGSNKVDTLYTKNSQRPVINGLVGLPPDSTKYIHDTNDYFLARGHLSPKSDYIYGTHQQATFHFVNVAPQWQTFNGQNWNVLEQDVQDYVASKGQDHEVYTGTHGVTTLPHELTGADVELYLYVDGSNRAIAAPQLFWKVLYNPSTKAGIAFVGINNPYHENVSSEIVCTDICSRLSWLNWDQKNIARGYSYCCDVNELKQVIGNIPNIDVGSVLT